MKLTYTQKTVQRKGKTYNVIILDNIGGFINRYGLIFDSDRIGLNVIMLSALLLVKNKNTIVYFPLKGNQIPDLYMAIAEKRFASDKLIYDVVFVHHAVQMPISDWIEIRQNLKYVKGRKKVWQTDITSEYNRYEKEYEKHQTTTIYHQSKDVFFVYDRFETCFFVGGRFSFMDLFIDLKNMLELPLEESFIKGKGFDYIVLPDKETRYDYELGYYDIHLEKQRFSVST